MKLYHLVEDAENKGFLEKELDTDILKITSDLGEVESGSLFFAVKGFKFDGNGLISAALENGAVAVITDNASLKHDPGVIVVENVRRALAYAANVFFNKP